MDKRKQWILGAETVEKFDRYREQRYQACGIKDFDHTLFTNYYLTLMIYFMRKRMNQKDSFFDNEQLLHSAVCLFKRFYLVNEHRRGEEPSQLVWTALYLSLKINELSEVEIKKTADAWKNKKSVNNLFNIHFKHYGDAGYTEVERQFLKGFGFQLGMTSLITPIESLFHLVEEHQENLNFANILSYLVKYLDKVYYDSRMIFEYSGPKLALAIMTVALVHSMEEDAKMVDEIAPQLFIDYYGEDVGAVLMTNWAQVNEIVEKLRNMPSFTLKDKQAKIGEMRKHFRTHKKHFQRPRSRSNQSPRISPERNLDVPPLVSHRTEEER